LRFILISWDNLTVFVTCVALFNTFVKPEMMAVFGFVHQGQMLPMSYIADMTNAVSTKGMVTSPHALASECGAKILRESNT
jgi:hypothetical protein